ncbi:MAG: Non-specific serine/threonine protein kinase [Cyanobacteriota bacterium erpe_2018_sw_21hr_WHONDRS-SW48-000092_B_bin.40]|jgi:serine/threonine protein kinase|nr:Non-specific serine/threonine protein kinase [Cyanobacteriota bacterium erpe_2018_sw_21hr_WHONDRS-SW48-000092_B_bin.40]
MIICPDDDTLLTPLLVDTLIGTTLADKYQILEKLGSGGMGLVYKAKHLLMKRLVAIKLMLPQFAASATALKRFRQEAQAASHLNHPNILKVYDFGVTPQGLPYLVMDLLEGTNLSAELTKHNYLPLERALKIFVQTCAALYHAHQKGVIHRDLKPGNIMLVDYDGQSDVVQIVDFGMAKILSEMDGENEELTKTGEVFGSPMYMSPEQCMGRELDGRSDIYSLGCVMYRTLTGRPAVAGASAMECFNKHATALPAPFAEVAPELMLPPSLEAIIFKAMAKEVHERQDSMAQLREELLAELGQAELSGSMPANSESPQQLSTSQSGSSSASISSSSSASTAAVVSASNTSNSKAETGENSHTQITNTGAVRLPARQSRVLENSMSQMQPSPKAARKGMIWASIAGVVIIASAIVLMPKGTTSKDGSKDPDQSPGQADPVSASEDYSQLIKQGQSSFDHGDYTEALKKFKIALEKARSSGDYDRVAEVRMALGRTYVEIQDLDDGQKEFQEILKIRESEKKLTALDATESMNELGKIYRAKGQFSQAQKLFNRALAIRQNYTGPDHAAVAETLADLGNLALEQKQFKKATELLAQAEKVASSTQGLADLNQANIFSAIGQAYQMQGQFDKATVYYEKALAIREKSLNPDNPAIADTLTYLGTLAFVKRDFAKADSYLHRALDIQEKTLSKDDPSIATTEFCLGVLYQQTKKYDKAEPLLADSLRIRTKALGANDPSTQQTKQLHDQVKAKIKN